MHTRSVMLAIQCLNIGQLFGPYVYCNQLINLLINLFQFVNGLGWYMIDHVQEMQNACSYNLHARNILLVGHHYIIPA